MCPSPAYNAAPSGLPPMEISPSMTSFLSSTDSTLRSIGLSPWWWCFQVRALVRTAAKKELEHDVGMIVLLEGEGVGENVDEPVHGGVDDDGGDDHG